MLKLAAALRRSWGADVRARDQTECVGFNAGVALPDFCSKRGYGRLQLHAALRCATISCAMSEAIVE
jgi:hypothetical protein